MKKTKLLFYLLSLSLIIGISCSQEDVKKGINESENETASELNKPPTAPPPIAGAQLVSNIQYAEGSSDGSDPLRTTFDIYIPKKFPNKRKPLVIFVHGGGFTSGDKGEFYNDVDKISDIKKLIDSGIAFANVNYRLEKDFSTDSLDGAPAEREDILKSMKDVKRCLQFIRKNFAQFKINKTRIGMYGSSAGGGCTIWLGLSDDMKNINDQDPVYHESTRLFAIGHMTSQASYSPSSFYNVFPTDIDCEILNQTVNNCDECDGETPAKACFSFPGIIDSYPELDFINFMTVDDPDMYISNTHPLLDANDDCEVCLDYVHSPYHAKALYEKANQIGISNKSIIDAFGINTTNNQTIIDFMISKLLP